MEGKIGRYDPEHTVHIKSQSELSPENIERWISEGITTVIIDGDNPMQPFTTTKAPEPFMLTAR